MHPSSGSPVSTALPWPAAGCYLRAPACKQTRCCSILRCCAAACASAWPFCLRQILPNIENAATAQANIQDRL